MDTWHIGATAPSWLLRFRNKRGQTPDISGGAFVLKFIDRASGQVTTGQGDFTVTDGPNGKVQYDLHDDDFANTGVGVKKVYVEGTVGGEIYKPKPFLIEVDQI